MSLVFATLKPANVLAKLAFSNVIDALGHQTVGIADPPADPRMAVDAQQVYDAEVRQLQREVERRREQTEEGYTSESLTDNTDAEDSLGMVWDGYFPLCFQRPPSDPDLGWTMGKGPQEGMQSADLLLCTRSFARQHNVTLARRHSRLNFSKDNRAFCIASCFRSYVLTLAVDSVAASRQLLPLDKHNVRIRIDKLEYILQYTDFASTEEYVEHREAYVIGNLGAPREIDFAMPTPLHNTRTVGPWTLGKPLGRGSYGRVFIGSNQKNEVVAVKVILRTTKLEKYVNTEVAAYKELTALAKKYDELGGIVRLREVIHSNDAKPLSTTGFEEVVLVLEPMTPQTFADLMRRSSGKTQGMSMEAAGAFYTALKALKVKHDNHWLHGDLKLANIGIIGHPPRGVLLDLASARHLLPGSKLKPTPGDGGTVGYLAPEREIQEHDHSIDIWAMGVIGYELMYGTHPWKLAVNPWRDNRPECEKLRPRFSQLYKDVISTLSTHYQNRGESRRYLHLGGLLVEMLRYPWAPCNHGPRIDISEVVQHPAWGPLLDKAQQTKKVRFDGREV